jgi:hypothetical protein
MVMRGVASGILAGGITFYRPGKRLGIRQLLIKANLLERIAYDKWSVHIML